MQYPGLSINDLFINVRSKVKKETGQVPWELSSLEGQFYFMPGSAKMVTEKADSNTTKTSPTDELGEEKASTLAMGKRPSQSTAVETGWDGRFRAYDNGTVLDTKTNLMWPAKDNGNNINWVNAKSYCENYRGGGYSDWRMPTQEELAGLYDAAKIQQNEAYPPYPLHLTELIDLNSCCHWASETCNISGAVFNFFSDKRDWYGQSNFYYFRALPVRSGK